MIASSPPPITSLSVTLRGQKYDVANVSTVQELQEQVETLSGVSPKQQGRVIFGGKRLTTDTVLTDAGVPDMGAHVNMVPSSSSSSSKKKKTVTASSSKVSAGASTSKSALSKDTSSSGSGSSSSPSNMMADLLKQSGIDSDALDDMMKSMGGGDGTPPNMEEGFKAMTEAMNSPLFKEMMGDPERLEQSRQMILNNPMLKSMMSGMPGMEDLLADPIAWRQAMQAAAELYKNMDTDTLMQAMMGGAEAAAAGSSSTSSLFDGVLDSDSSTVAALNELDEDD